MAKKQLTLPGEIVKKSNAIIRARWQPESIWEPRIVALVASKVRATDEDFFIYRIPVAELAGVSGEQLQGSQYKEIAKSIEHLGRAIIRIEGNKPRNFRQYNIFSMCGYEDGYLIARFDPDLKPHFLSLKENFTEYNLIQFLKLPSTYSQKLFEILKSWSRLPEILLSISELHEMLSTPQSFRTDFRQFRIYVLEKAHNDILKHTTLRYEWKPIKKGRAVVAIRFIFSQKRSLPVLKQKEDNARQKLVEKNNDIGKAAVECSQKKNGRCTRQDNKPEVCKYCMQFGVCKEIALNLL